MKIICFGIFPVLTSLLQLNFLSDWFIWEFRSSLRKTSRTNRQKFETELVSVWRVFSSPLELSLPLGGLPAEPVVWPSHNNGPVYGGCCGGGGAVTSPSPASCSRFLRLSLRLVLYLYSPHSYIFPSSAMCDPWVLLPKSRHRKTIAYPRCLIVRLSGCSKVGGMRKGDETGENEVISSVRKRLLFVLSPLL